MKISSDHVGRIMGAELRSKSRLRRVDASASQPDKVSLSRQADWLRVAQNALESSPEVNSTKVEALRRQVEQGAYKVDSETLAEDLLRESILQKQSR